MSGVDSPQCVQFLVVSESSLDTLRSVLCGEQRDQNMGQVVAHKRLKTMKNSKTVTHKSGGSGLQFKRWFFMGGFQQYCKALMTLGLWEVLAHGGFVGTILVVTHALTLSSISYSFLNLLYQSILKAVMTGT